MKEKDFQNIIIKYPELIEKELELIKIQPHILNDRIPDLLFKDKNDKKLFVELKVIPVSYKELGQIISYKGVLISKKEIDTRIMIIGTNIRLDVKKSLDTNGVEWKEIKFSDVKKFLTEKEDLSFSYLFSEENLLNQYFDEKQPSNLSEIDTSEFPELVETIINTVIKSISNNITASIGKRYSSYFLNGKRFLHFYDRSPTRIQLHLDKRYLQNERKTFDMNKINEYFEVNETNDDYPIKIKSKKNIEVLANCLSELYGKRV